MWVRSASGESFLSVVIGRGSFKTVNSSRVRMAVCQSKNVDLMYSPDFGATITRLVYRGNKFLLSNGYFFVAKVKDALKQSVSLLVSTDGGKSFQVRDTPNGPADQFVSTCPSCLLV